MEYNYLVPANSKKQTLIFGILAKSDVPILVVGAVVTIPLLILLPLSEIWGLVVALLPIIFAAFLVFPIPNYHNVRTFIREMYRFYFVRRRKYIWRGWCYKYEQSDEQSDGQQWTNQ